MKVTVDNLWSTPSALHMRVHVHDDNGRWRHRYDVSIPVDEIAPEAIQTLVKESCQHHLEDVALPGM